MLIIRLWNSHKWLKPNLRFEPPAAWQLPELHNLMQVGSYRCGREESRMDPSALLEVPPPPEMCSGTEAGSYLRLIDSCITQLKAPGPSRKKTGGWTRRPAGGRRAAHLFLNSATTPAPLARTDHVLVVVASGKHVSSCHRSSHVTTTITHPISISICVGWVDRNVPQHRFLRKGRVVPRALPCSTAVGSFFFFFTLVTGPRRSLSLKLSDTRV